MDEESLDAPQTKPRKKAVRKPKAVVRLEEEEESDADALPRFKSPPKKAKAKAKAASTPDSSESSADELPRFLNAKVLAKGKAKDPPELPVRGESDPFYEPPARPEPIIRDLTKGKNKAPERDLKNFFPLANARARAKASTSIPSSAPLRPTKYATAAVDNGILPLSAPTPRRQELRSADAPISGPSKAPPCTTDSERREMLESAISLPSTPSGNKRAKKAPAPAHSELSEAENTSIAPKMVPRPFPLFDDTPPSRSKLARRKPSTSSDSDSRESRINKSPRKSAQHISPREKGVLRAASPTPQRLRAPTTEASKYPVIDISSDSDAPSPPPRPKARRPAAKPVLQPSNVVKLGNNIIDLSDL
jgi:Holliday junction resolvase YEN1